MSIGILIPVFNDWAAITELPCRFPSGSIPSSGFRLGEPPDHLAQGTRNRRHIAAKKGASPGKVEPVIQDIDPATIATFSIWRYFRSAIQLKASRYSKSYLG